MLTVQYPGSSGVSGPSLAYAYINAAVLLHELGHVIADLPGSSGDQITDDSGSSSASQANTLKILQACGLGAQLAK